MVEPLHIGVLALQGAFREHQLMLERCGAKVTEIRRLRDGLERFDGIVLPGGESTTMGRLSPNVLEAWWLRDRETLGLDGWAFHELRHSYLSTLALRGVHPKVMQELAGHASSEITMEIYTHVNMEAKRAAADVVSDLFSEPVEAAPAITPIVQVEPRVINGGRRLTLVSSPRERVENAPESTSEQPQERFVPDSYQAAIR